MGKLDPTFSSDPPEDEGGRWYVFNPYENKPPISYSRPLQDGRVLQVEPGVGFDRHGTAVWGWGLSIDDDGRIEPVHTHSGPNHFTDPRDALRLGDAIAAELDRWAAKPPPFAADTPLEEIDLAATPVTASRLLDVRAATADELARARVAGCFADLGLPAVTVRKLGATRGAGGWDSTAILLVTDAETHARLLGAENDAAVRLALAEGRVLHSMVIDS
jgi:hypothetical protein